jgi:hypothetical protein
MAMSINVATPISAAFTDEIIPKRYAGGNVNFETEHSFGAMNQHPRLAWAAIEDQLKRVIAATERDADKARFSTLARIECFQIDARDERGMAIFDSQGRLVIHITNAVLGEPGAASELCLNIMTRLLDIPREMFGHIEEEILGGQQYKIVVSRELPSEDRQATAVKGQWFWWRVR